MGTGTGKESTMKKYEHSNTEPVVVMQGAVTVSIDPQSPKKKAARDAKPWCEAKEAWLPASEH